MDLNQILTDFENKKEKIDKKIRSNRENYLNGLEMANSYANTMEYVVKNLFDLTSKKLEEKGEGIAAFLYGSPGRREMVSESDLDIMLVYKNQSKKYIDFKEKFRELAQPLEFCKVDLPDWGTLNEAESFAKKSITEGNQVLEDRFVCGDEKIKEGIEKIKEKYGNPNRMARNIVFQKFYFDQYFKQRVRDGAINIKYCDGGSRDYLFIHWFNQLMKRKYPEWNKTTNKKPVAEQGLSNLYQNKVIDSFEFGRAIDALNFNLLFRNEILLANKGTNDEGLSFLDQKTLDSVFKRNPRLMEEYHIKSPEELAGVFEKQRKHISNIKYRIFNSMIKEKGKEKNIPGWAERFHEAYSESTPERKRKGIFYKYKKDPLIKIASIWGASNSRQISLLEDICQEEKNSGSWEVQASLTTSPYCPSNYLHHIGEGIGKEEGYGYILRIISRNPNTKTKTLKSIANDSKIEKRYKQCAEASLKGGNESANHQV